MNEAANELKCKLSLMGWTEVRENRWKYLVNGKAERTIYFMDTYVSHSHKNETLHSMYEDAQGMERVTAKAASTSSIQRSSKHDRN